MRIHRGQIPLRHGGAEFGGYVAARVLEQRDEIVAAGSRHRVLEIDDPDPCRAFHRSRQPYQILRVIVAMHKNW